MRVSVLVPFRADPAGERTRLRDFVHSRFVGMALRHEIEPEIIYQDDRGDDPDLFNRGQAINDAYDRASHDLLLIMDADTTYDHGDAFALALRSTQLDGFWRLPELYVQLTPNATSQLVDGGRSDFLAGLVTPTTDVEWSGRSWSGLVILPRAAFDAIGGADERYVGHGADDVALGVALDTLYGTHIRAPFKALHLHHPRGDQERCAFRADLTGEYEQARGDIDAMYRVVEGKRS